MVRGDRRQDHVLREAVERCARVLLPRGYVLSDRGPAPAGRWVLFGGRRDTSPRNGQLGTLFLRLTHEPEQRRLRIESAYLEGQREKRRRLLLKRYASAANATVAIEAVVMAVTTWTR